jgi:hypothetical protein
MRARAHRGLVQARGGREAIDERLSSLNCPTARTTMYGHLPNTHHATTHRAHSNPLGPVPVQVPCPTTAKLGIRTHSWCTQHRLLISQLLPTACKLGEKFHL